MSGPRGEPDGARVVPFDALARAVLARPARLGGVRLVAVDGPSGAGKTTFAGRLAAALDGLPAGAARVFHSDDLLDGWGDMLTFWPRLREWVLDPLRRGEPGSYRRYDWHAGAFESRWRPVPVPRVLVLEGVSCGRAEGRAELSALVWVDAPQPERMARSLARDGAHTRPRLVEWMAAERAHFARDRPDRAADVRVDGGCGALPFEAGPGFLGVVSGWTGLTG